MIFESIKLAIYRSSIVLLNIRGKPKKKNLKFEKLKIGLH